MDIKARLVRRGTDSYGSGAFGAPRGERTHRGVDFLCEADTEILAPVSGPVTKIGYPYADDLSYRYVEIRAEDGALVRVFYISPAVGIGAVVKADQTVIGTSQDLQRRYGVDAAHPAPISNHVHLEIKALVPGSGGLDDSAPRLTYVDPTEYVIGSARATA